MMRFLACMVVIFWSCIALAAAGPRDVLAHSSGDWTWCARVEAITPAELSNAAPTATEQTEIFARQNGPGQKWQLLPKLSGRVIALASRSSQLAVLMSSGEWLTLWADGSATGQLLPADGHLITLADDGKDLWAVGTVKGGMAAAMADLARQRSATQPTTERLGDDPAAVDAEQLHITRSALSKVVIFHEQNGRWVAVAELPADSMMPDQALLSNLAGGLPEVTADDISLAIVGGLPMVSVKTRNNAVRIMSYGPGDSWGEVRWPDRPSARPIDAFAVLAEGIKPALWWTTGNSPGEIYPDVARTASSVSLQWVSKDTFDGLPAVTFSGGYLCLFGPHRGDVIEQRYKLTGQPVETAEPIALPPDHEPVFPIWLEAAFLASMGFSVGASMHRQWLNQSQPEEATELPAPAPLWLRSAAGLVDLIPVIAATVYLLAGNNWTYEPRDMPVARSLIIFFGAFAIYVLHTTVVETLTGRTLGKWIFGLKVTTLLGESPTRSQFLIRNLLRIVDPLVMIIVSPLHQRSADTVAGTIVVRAGGAPTAGKPTDENADKSN